jgi:hypothetical protein
MDCSPRDLAEAYAVVRDRVTDEHAVLLDDAMIHAFTVAVSQYTGATNTTALAKREGNDRSGGQVRDRIPQVHDSAEDDTTRCPLCDSPGRVFDWGYGVHGPRLCPAQRQAHHLGQCELEGSARGNRGASTSR